MTEVVNFNTLVEINQILAKEKIEYSLHSIGGCVSCGLVLKQDGEEYPVEKIIEIINDYLQKQWKKVILDDKETMHLSVISQFNN